MVLPKSGSTDVIPTGALSRSTREGMIAELQARGLEVEGPILVLTLTAVRRAHRSRGAHPLPSVRDALRGLRVGLRRDTDTDTAASVAADCGDVAAWLTSQGALRTACGFAEIAAALDGAAGVRALTVANLARRLDRKTDAVAWGVRAWRLAGQSGRTDTRAAALVALGQVALRAEQFSEAERLFNLACRYARAHAASIAEGDALHGLALVNHARERDDEAAVLVMEALVTYGSRSEQVQTRARSLLGMWVAASGYRGALSIGRLLLSLPLPKCDEMAVCALCARASAALGWELAYETFSLRAIVTLGKLPAEATHAPAMLDLARAHGALGFWPRMMLAAERARDNARVHGAEETAAIAQRMLDAVRMPEIPSDVLSSLFPDEETEEIPEGEEPPAWSPVGKMVAAFADALGLA